MTVHNEYMYIRPAQITRQSKTLENAFMGYSRSWDQGAFLLYSRRMESVLSSLSNIEMPISTIFIFLCLSLEGQKGTTSAPCLIFCDMNQLSLFVPAWKASEQCGPKGIAIWKESRQYGPKGVAVWKKSEQ